MRNLNTREASSNLNRLSQSLESAYAVTVMIDRVAGDSTDVLLVPALTGALLLILRDARDTWDELGV